ncbi:hypothetical protein [Aneurinibacillus terranovensis]
MSDTNVGHAACSRHNAGNVSGRSVSTVLADLSAPIQRFTFFRRWTECNL